MAVSRENAVVGEPIELRLIVRDRSGALIDAASVGPVSVYDDGTGAQLETVAAPARVRRGVYLAVTDPAWNDRPRTVRDEWLVTPPGATAPTTVRETFPVRDPAGCAPPDHVDDGVPVLVGSVSGGASRGLWELRVTEDRLHEEVPRDTPVSCLGDRLLDARQRAELCCHRRGAGEGSFDAAGDPTLEVHPHTPWWNALIRIFSLAPSARVGRMWLEDRVCAGPPARPQSVVLVFRYVSCDPS
jgi:hypothetical protein